MVQQLTREQVPIEETWNLEDLFPNPEAWEVERESILRDLGALEQLRGTLRQGVSQVLRVLLLADELDQRVSKLYAYALLARDQDTRDTAAAERYERAVYVGTLAGRASAWIAPELLATYDDTALLEMVKHEPGLAPFRRFLERLVRERPHVRSAEVEELLAETAPLAHAPSTAFTLLDNADIRYGTVTDVDGSTVELTKGRYQLLLERRDRRVRQQAYEVFNAPYIAHRHTLAALLSAANQRDAFYARARRYDSALHAALHPDNIPVEVYTTLIALVRQHADLLQRYLALRKRVLGLERLRTFDLYVPLVERPERSYTYQEARELVLEALRPLGADYVEPLRAGLANRWVDVHETVGKRSGGYSLGVYGVHPYILLNWNGTLREVFTLAHELGHAMHSYFSSRTQPHPTAEYTIFVAEVASTFNERLLTHALLETTTDPRERAALVNDALDTFRIALYRQTLFAEFELLTHQAVERGEGLSADGLCTLYGRLISEYYGPDLELDDEVRHEWSRVPHFYRAFYVYQYATGLVAATALARAVLEGDEVARQRYLAFLAAGSSKDSLELLRDAGVDLTTAEPYRAAFATMEQDLATLESALVELGMVR
ncbi:oligoendopeptidase F [Thermomicrobium sp. CFH 73360]|uniref:oligoendopeptidase F n=1 Tax=Thermomicrobium sp. CFH 73360 TaxID=2951987 RepID=UPI00207723FA|nr:oligoendopeptidase F [Thermomicrobium sp. CFH 73360]